MTSSPTHHQPRADVAEWSPLVAAPRWSSAPSRHPPPPLTRPRRRPDRRKGRWITKTHRGDERRGEGRPAVLHPRLRQHRRLVRRQQRRGVRAGNAARDHREVPPRRRPLLRLDHSVDNPQQIAGLSNGIQQVSTSTGAEVPSLISIDQEGGLVARVLEPATQTPGNMALGATRDVTRHPRPRGHPGHRARGHGHHAELRAGGRRQRQPGQPGDRRAVVRQRPRPGRRR